MAHPMHIHGVGDSEFSVFVVDSVEVFNVVDTFCTAVSDFST